VAGGEPLLIAGPAARWLADHAQSERAQFLYKAWLDAGGERERELLRTPIEHWLSVHRDSIGVSFVCAAWLKAGGEPALISDDLRRWMRVHGHSPSARYVRRAWTRRCTGFDR
jgi:hypothetical protein